MRSDVDLLTTFTSVPVVIFIRIPASSVRRVVRELFDYGLLLRDFLCSRLILIDSAAVIAGIIPDISGRQMSCLFFSCFLQCMRHAGECTIVVLKTSFEAPFSTTA